MSLKPDAQPADRVRSNSLGARLLRSHMTVAAIGLALLGLILLFTFYMRARTVELARIHAPLAEASRAALQGVERSLADLRGWVVMRDEQFIRSRHRAWSEQIESALDRMRALNSRREVEDEARLREARRLLSELKEIQWWIEDVAQTPGNEPARDLLVSRQQPTIGEIYAVVSAMIEEESRIEEPGRSRRILAAMADFRGWFTRSGATLEALQSSDTGVDERAFRTQLAFARGRLGDLARDAARLTPDQRALLAQIESQLPHYASLADEIIERRRTPQWNIAQFLLREEAVPKSREVIARLTALAEEHGRRVTKDADRLEQLSRIATGVSGLFFLGMAGSAWLIARRGTARLLQPIENLSQATRKMAAGEWTEDLPVTGDDELSRLMVSFNQMHAAVALAEEGLRRQEEESRTVIEASPSGMVMVDEEGMVRMLNRQAATLFGYRREELLGQPIETLVPDSVRGHHHELRGSYMKHPDVRAMGAGRNLFGKRKDGSEIPIEIGLNPIHTGEGVRVLAGIIDLSERKRAETLLARQAMEARLLHRSVALASESTGFEDALQRCLDEVCEATGWGVGHAYLPAQDGRSLEATSIWHRDDKAAHHEFRKLTEQTSFARGIGLPGRIWESGESSWIVDVHQDPNFPRATHCQDMGLTSAFGFPIKIRDQIVAVLEFFTEERVEPDANLLVLTDSVGNQVGRVLERQRSEEEMKLLSNRLVQATKAGEIGVWDYDVVNNVLVWDDQMYRLYGITPQRFSGAYQAWEEGLHPDDVDSESEKLQRAIRGEEAFNTEFRVIWPDDGSVHFIKANATVLQDENGNAVRMIGTNWDITAQRHAEEELREAKRTAEAASKAKSEFLANMSHEIRTPMNGILGMTDLLLGTQLSKDQREYLHLVSQSADSLLNVINDILDFSKIEAGKLELDPHEFDLRDSIGDTLQTLGFRASEKGLELAYQVQSNVPDCLVGDLGRLRQTLVNLVGNAMKFTEKGEVVIDVQLESRTEDQVTLYVLVRDTGIGIPPEKQAAIFDSFTQAEGSTTRKFGGTGLGLTISRQLVELMQGRIWLESEPGIGSTFHFTAQLELGSDHPHPARAAPETLKDLPVLIIDDNDTNRLILQEMLTNWEMGPVSASSGPAALETLEAASTSGRPIQLILLDMMMPGMDGPEVARRVRERYGNKAPAIIVLSSAGHHSVSAEESRSLGIQRMLMKPAKQSDILDAITRVFGTATRDESDAPKTGALPSDIRPMSLLLAEDGRVNQKVAIRLLEGRGHSVVLAENGAQAVEALEKQVFDAVLMDIQMPVMDGYEATGVIRAKERITGEHIPIIAMTANAMKGDREACLEAGMDDYVAKPVRSQELFATLEKYAGEAPAALPREPDRPQASAGEAVGAPPMNRDQAMERTGGSEEMLREMMGLFTEECAAMMAAIDQAIAAGDAPGLELAAHTLKGAAGILAAQPTVDASFVLEKIGASGNLASAGASRTDLRRAIDALLPLLSNDNPGGEP